MRLLAALLLAVHCSAVEPSSPTSEVGWKLVWSDEFNTPGRPDPTKWDFERGFVRNEEPQWYQEDNARVADGCLLIEARREHVPNPHYLAGSKSWTTSRAFAEYTSASLTTRGLHRWTYGRFDIRGRIDTRQGLWPAFWFVGDNGGWPSCGEIDLMEWYEGKLLANLCWGPDSRHQKWATTKRGWEAFAALPPSVTGHDFSAWSRDFHVWTMVWDARQIVLQVDGRTLNTVDVATAKVGEDLPFRKPMHLILNLAVRDADHPEHTTFPARLEVDWVRVWQQR